MPSATKSELLKKLLDAKKARTPFQQKLERYLLEQTNTRSTTVLHPSEVTKPDWCIRRSWFLLNGAVPKQDNPNLRLALIFEEGHLIHEKWQKWLTDMDVLLGKWWCRDHKTSWFGRRSDSHRGCWVEYQEVPVHADPGDLPIHGHADGWITGIHDRDSLLEIKSIGTGTIRANKGRLDDKGLARSFSYIDHPYAQHVRQVMLYLWCLRNMYDEGSLSLEPPTQAFILYECKEDQNIKEFTVQYDEEYLDPFFTRLEMLDLDDHPPDCTGTPAAGEIYCTQCREFTV